MKKFFNKSKLIWFCFTIAAGVVCSTNINAAVMLNEDDPYPGLVFSAIDGIPHDNEFGDLPEFGGNLSNQNVPKVEKIIKKIMPLDEEVVYGVDNNNQNVPISVQREDAFEDNPLLSGIRRAIAEWSRNVERNLPYMFREVKIAKWARSKCKHENTKTVANCEKCKALRIKHMVFKKSEKKGCPLCKEVFKKGEKIVSPCCSGKHLFHSVCLKKWHGTKRECPLCQEVLLKDFKEAVCPVEITIISNEESKEEEEEEENEEELAKEFEKLKLLAKPNNNNNNINLNGANDDNGNNDSDYDSDYFVFEVD